MKILALEFSSPRRSVAVLTGGQACGRAVEESGRESRALALVEAVLDAAGWDRAQVDCLAVGLGPGSYTGIRSAIALAQGWQLARGTRVVGVSTVECLAVQAQAGSIPGPYHIVIDAQRNELYHACYKIEAANPVEVEPLRIASVEDVGRKVAAGGTVIGPEAARWFPAGHVMYPDAVMTGQLAAERGKVMAAEMLEPIYLRETAFVKAPVPRIIPAS